MNPAFLAAITVLNVISPNPATTIWSPAPASHFYESSVLGNGRLGAMVFGGVTHERVVLNESTMWSGSPQDADRKEAHEVLPEIRRLVLAGDNVEAEALMQKNFVCAGPGSGGPRYGCYQTFGDLLIDAPDVQASDYRRSLDLDRAVATVEYSSGGIRFTREALTSAPAQTFVYRYRADKPGSIEFVARLVRSERASTNVDGTDIVISGELDSGAEGVAGVRFSGRLRVITDGGSVHADQAGIHVSGANEATLIFSAGTSMFDPAFSDKVKAHVDAAAGSSFDTLERQSTKDHQRFFRRVSLRLPEGPSAHKPTLERMTAADAGEEDPALAALYFNFGRYLLISSSRPDSPLPANLQGIWAEELRTPWNGDFHLDLNVQMNYWLAETTNLGDCHLPLIHLIPKLQPNGEKTAQAYYGAHGWVAHAITNPWFFTSPGESSSWGSFCGGAAWLCEHLWNHYAFNLDVRYLRSVYPTMRGAAEFFMDMLVPEPHHGWLVTSPSNSPENSFVDPKTGRPVSNCMGPTMDMQLVRELFGNVIASSRILDVDPELRAKLVAATDRLAPTRIGKHGQIMEWLEDYDETDVHHRHISHLYGLYPASEISTDHTPELAAAAKVTLERRGDDGVGWALAWKACCWARLFDGDHAWRMLKLLLHPVTDTGVRYDKGGGAYPNLLDACPPFQIDGNFGGAAAVAEMLVQSRDGELRLLPALPKAWKEGSVSGLRAIGGVTISFSWKDGKVTSYRLTGPAAKRIKVRLPSAS